MAHYVRIPKDLNDIKEKFMMNLTKRQVICFGIGFACGIPVFFLTKNVLGLSGAIVLMGVVAAPAIVCGLYRKNGVYFENTFRFMLDFFRKPRKRYYRTTNVYMSIENQIEYNRLKQKLFEAEGGNTSGTIPKKSKQGK